MGSRWVDSDDEVDDYLPERTESRPDAKGIRTIVEWYRNDSGEKVKVTKRVRTVKRTTMTSKMALERKKWAKFGKAKNREENDSVTYVSYDEIKLEDPTKEEKKQETVDEMMDKLGSAIIMCKHCGMAGDHWTLKCPYKDGGKPGDASAGRPTAEDKMREGKYVPPSLRNRSEDGGSRMQSDKDDRDSATLRVTNISSEAREADLQELFRSFGPIQRLFLAKDRETMQSRGFAFVSYVFRKDAESALNALQGFGYDHLILNVEWAKPSKQDEGGMQTTFRSGYGKALPQGL